MVASWHGNMVLTKGNGRSLGSQRLLFEPDTGVAGAPNVRWQERFAPGSDGWQDLELDSPTTSGGGGTVDGLTPTAIKTSTYNAAASDLVYTDSSGGSFTVTLPISPADGAQVGLLDTSSSWASAPVLVVPGGGDTVLGATGLSCDDPAGHVTVQYVAGTSDWVLVAGGVVAGTSQAGLYATDAQFAGGMVGDSSTDNVAALRSIAAFCAANPGASVLLPPATGTYRINSLADMSGPLRLVAAPGAERPVIKAGPGFDVAGGRYMLAPVVAGDSLLEGLEIDGQASGLLNLTGIYVFAGGSLRVRDCRIRRTWTSAADAAAGQGWGVFGQDLDLFEVGGCTLEQNNGGLVAYGACGSVRFTDNLLFDGHRDGITLLGTGSGATASAIIAGNRLHEWASQTHLITASTSGARAELVQLLHNHCTGQNLAYSAGGNADLVSINGIRTLVAIGGMAELGGDYGWTFEDVLDGTVSGLVGRRNNSGGISFWKCKQMSAAALTAVDNYQDRASEYDFGSLPRSGIHIWGGSGPLTVSGWRSGNTTGGGGKQTYGLTAQDRDPNSGAVLPHVGKVTIGQGDGSGNRLGPLLFSDGQDQTAAMHVVKVAPAGGVDYPTTGLQTAAGCEIRLTRPVYAKPLWKTAIGSQHARVTTTAAAGATTLTVSAVLGGLAAGDHVSIVLDDGSTHHTTAGAGSTGTSLVIAGAIPAGRSALAGAPVAMAQFLNGPNLA
jgi:hypothetical protein